jgi:Zn finger protein HypA/HybF involved in hydrogenase expression
MHTIWDDIDTVTQAISTSTTRKEAVEKLNRAPSTVQYRRLKQFEREHCIDVSHFTPYKSSARVNATTANRQYTVDEMFCKGSSASMSAIKRRIRRDSLLEIKCRDCDIVDNWNGKPLVLQLEHIDGDNTNQELTNLCYLCPNCHSQTDTFCGKNAQYKNRKTLQSVEERTAQRKQSQVVTNQPLMDAVLKSNIDFKRHGWSKQVALLIGKNPQKVKDWMVRYLPDLYANCYHHRSNTTTRT